MDGYIENKYESYSDCSALLYALSPASSHTSVGWLADHARYASRAAAW